MSCVPQCRHSDQDLGEYKILVNSWIYCIIVTLRCHLLMRPFSVKFWRQISIESLSYLIAVFLPNSCSKALVWIPSVFYLWNILIFLLFFFHLFCLFIGWCLVFTLSFLLSNTWFLFPLYRWYRCTNPNFVGILVFEAVVFSSSEVHEPLYAWFILYSYTQWIFFTLFLTVAIQLSSKSVSGKMRPLF